ncbi:MAG: hypothetical protein JWL64_520 [Frankiales bacterium]|nr:hypothetical protein [Frankiales bacterium]
MSPAGPEVWAFDVDGTLVDSMSGSSLRPYALELLTVLHERGVTLVLWSAGGREHADAMSLRHRFGHLFAAVYDKGDPDAAGRLPTAHLPARHVPHVVVDDRPEEAPAGTRVVAVPGYVSPDPTDRGLVPLLGLERAAVSATGAGPNPVTAGNRIGSCTSTSGAVRAHAVAMDHDLLEHEDHGFGQTGLETLPTEGDRDEPHPD